MQHSGIRTVRIECFRSQNGKHKVSWTKNDKDLVYRGHNDKGSVLRDQDDKNEMNVSV